MSSKEGNEDTGSCMWRRKTLKVEEGQITGRWSQADSAKLRELYEANVSIAEICKLLHRDKTSVLNKVAHSINLHRPVNTAT